ncbi:MULTISPECIES: plasmid pRiA4b ORF-3 family protein [unclassified Brenneria]|uniref:plasmid pRiA4b ORF-3 family protein n=1 Tax=unclassified Brenneria TaxID=2634434 RepID=UPI0029C2AB92|nr:MULTISPECIES: plasmid pRiA4b ORF-3 family protein [unclassified Brenneria]MDX5627786.1 plasmid pRiA4b ORF-3 family protein [Brenneria sp. L3-3Z]MDX5695123.1 plasmid pRiA4b ORF-3 family protein [Brenneria sp. L4-2C]
MSTKYYQLKVSLIGTTPAIWRRFVVPAAITLDRLHDVLQIVMGWEDSHFHEFIFSKKRFTEHPEDASQGEDEGFYRLNELLKRKSNKLLYTYDFGDGWEHEIILENNNYIPDEFDGFLFCLGGERVCPPEDCGGVPGYENLLGILQDPTHEDYEETLEWLGIPAELLEIAPDIFEEFDAEEVNGNLALYARWTRDRYQPWLDEE